MTTRAYIYLVLFICMMFCGLSFVFFPSTTSNTVIVIGGLLLVNMAWGCVLSLKKEIEGKQIDSLIEDIKINELLNEEKK